MISNHISKLANKYLTGLDGVEIGGCSRHDFRLNTINVDRVVDQASNERSIAAGYKINKIDVFSDGARLPFDNKSYDFIINSHVIEHFTDPISALIEWRRVAKKYIFIICPHKDRMFDRDKETTTLKELVKRHFTLNKHEEHNHQSFWNTEAFIELCESLDFNVVEFQDPDDRIGNGFTVVIKL